MSALPAPSDDLWPALAEGLEEVCVQGGRDMPAALAFTLSRLPAGDRRPAAMAVGRLWQAEHGRPYGPGLACAGLSSRRSGLLLISGRTEAEMLWTMEQALRSGAVSMMLGTVENASLAQTRRLEFAARDGEAIGVLLRQTQGGLNAARRRWRISSVESALHDDDRRAPGRFRLRAELTRSRQERPGVWMLEQDDETHRLRLADRLAGDGQGERGRTVVAA